MTLVLFEEHLALIVRDRPPRPTTPRPTRPATPERYAARYGAGNTRLADVLPAVAPKKRASAPRYPLAEKDPFAEWANPHDMALHDLLVALESLPHHYDLSCGYLRAGRPRTASEGLRFWAAPLSRAHLMNALLLRGDRSIKQVQQDCDVGGDKWFDYKDRWGIVWGEAKRDALLQDATGRAQPARVVRFHRESGEATLRPEGFALEVRARYDARARLFITPQTLPTNDGLLVSYETAARLANLTPDTLRRLLPSALTTDSGRGVLHLARLEAVLPRHIWRMTLEEALADTNTCRCAFFDHLTARCGLSGRPTPPEGTASYACPDFEGA